MNQWLADLFLALPRDFVEPRVFGSVCLGLLWLGYVFFVRYPVRRAVEEHCSEDTLARMRVRPWQRLLYSSLRATAHLDERGRYAMHLGSLIGLVCATVVHVLLFGLSARGFAAADVADRALLTAAVGAVGTFCLCTQPSATVGRRTRWGFSRANAVIHALLWEVLMVILMLLWVYDAWFLPLFLV